MAELKFKVGDKVFVNGIIYQSANGTLTKGKAEKLHSTVKRVAQNAPHPYAVEGLYGWFEEKELKPELTVQIGDKVKVRKPITYGGKTVSLRYPDYIITNIVDDKATITHNQAQTIVVSAYNLEKI